MKLHSLEMQAFGPFAKTERIDFEQLGRNPLFLIDGPTGAGKSSILHAICYALYGETTDADRKELGLRCDHADKDLLTQLILEFSIRDQRYRIQRVPTQMRPAKKGEGETEQKATAELSQIVAEGIQHTLVAKKVNDAKAQIHIIVGLTAEQFRQVMVLPQGKFRELLLASSDDRQKILSTLFQTEVYKKIEESLKEKSADIERKNKAFEASKADALSDVELTDRDALLLSITHAEQVCLEQFKHKEHAQKQHQTVLNQFKAAEQLATTFESLAKKEAQVQHALAQTEVIQDKKKTIKLAEKAYSIAPKWHTLKAVLSDVVNKQTEIDQANVQQSEIMQAVEVAKTEFEQAEQNYQQRDTLKQEQTQLMSYQKTLENYAKLEKNALDTHAVYRNATTLNEQYRRDVHSLISDISKCSNSTEILQKQISIKADLTQKKAEALQQLQQRKKLNRAKVEFDKLMLNQQQKLTILENTRAEYTRKKHSADQLEMQWHSHQAAILAAELKVDEACAVCGSIEHPNPAVLPDDTPKQHEVEAARLAQEACVDMGTKANTESTDANNLVQHKQVEINELETELADVTQETVESLTHHIHELEQQLVDISKHEVTLDINKQQLVNLHSKQTELNNMLAESEKSLPILSANNAKAQAELHNAQSDLPERYRNKIRLNTALEHVQKHLSSIELAYQLTAKANTEVLQKQASINATLQTLNTHLSSLNSSKLDHEAVWKQALSDSDFSDQQAFDIASLNNEALHIYISEVKNYDEQLHALKVEKELLTQQLESKARPDLAAFQQRITEAGLNYKTHEANWNTAEKYKAKLEDVDKKLQRIDKQQAEIKKQYEVIGTLSNAASGKGNIKVSLERFVLGNLLDSVLSRASQRLHIMSKGQYRLIRQKESEQKRNKTAGLDLAIDDAYTGKTRPVATLSGGESFMASLSLALGLSDVVQERSGGIQLDTLFIDEGFGSLDQESLQLAIQTLIDLQSTGRTIGIISHVSELKEQMSQRIDVIGTRQGSAIKVIA
jgi:exonuclease SbcC